MTTYLDYSYTQIKELDLSKNVELKWFSCDETVKLYINKDQMYLVGSKNNPYEII